MTRCYICGAPGTETHEIFFGTANRKNSIDNGCYVKLCYEHHRGKTGAHQCRETDLMLKLRCQEEFIRRHSEDEFRRIFGRMWTADEQTEATGGRNTTTGGKNITTGGILYKIDCVPDGFVPMDNYTESTKKNAL